MSKEKNNKNYSENTKYSQISKENEIIEEIINNPLLLKDIEGLEEEEDEDSIIEENELKEKERKNNTNKKTSKVHKNIIENLFIDLFEYHYNEISTEKKNKFRKYNL